ncbi:MAG: HDOD domain-containing protein [Tepidisphaeraceae bacterium]
MPDLKDKRIDLILQQLDELPTLPAVAVRVLEVTGSDSSSAKEVVQLIESDPSLTARILQLVHRADLGVRGEVTSVDRAVSLLGFEAVRSAVLAIGVFQTFQPDSKLPAQRFSREEFWKHCVAVACCAEMLAVATRGKINPSEAFVCGLLHDLGKVALDAMLPKSFARVVEAVDLLRGNIADVERTVVGLDHMVVGKRLAEKWHLPQSIRECVWLHGQTPEALPATVKNPSLVNLITLADLLAREQHVGYSGNYSFAINRNALFDAVGLSRQQVEDAIRNLVSHLEPRAKALGLGQASSAELYQQALSQANRELGRVSGELASKNRKLATRAKFFEALSQFQAELRPDAPPQRVLSAIGQTAVAVLDVTSAAVFSLPPGREYAEAVLVDHAGDVFENSLVDLTGSVKDGKLPLAPTPGDGPVLSAGRELEWLLSAISPRLGFDHRFWICLEADGACIGGVVWGAQSGESQRLSTQTQELLAISGGWSLALRTAQIREEARALSEQLAETNRQLQSAQSEILRSRTLISVGEMAAGAAHEMNNPLAVISGRSQLLAAQLADAKHKAAAHLIHEQSHRLSQIISELMDFATPTAPKLADTDVSELLDRALHQAKTQSESADRTVELTVSDVPNVSVDPEQVAGAIAEVIDNAFQATDEKKDKGAGVQIHAAFDPYSNRVVLSVTDNGAGMDEVTLRRAFDPFFSSKPAGRRRGMGLAKALRWVESSGGSIRLESHPSQGTRAIVLLPAVKARVAAEPAPARKRAQA